MKQNTTSARIVSEIRAQIRSGKLAPGDHVPSAREIVRDHGVAIATATRVIAILKREGLVRTKAGVGTIVRGERGVELTRERIVETAIAIADDEGTGALTMRLLARELGVATMSLYRHVRSREELLEQMADAVLGEVDTTAPKGARGKRPPSPRAELERIAQLQWAGYRRHTWLAGVLSMTRPQLLPNGMKATEAVLHCVKELGLPRAETLQTAIAFIAYVRGMATGLESEIHAEQDTGITSDEWIASRESEFAKYMKSFPLLTEYGAPPDIPMGIDALFERGLQCFLDGLTPSTIKKRSP